MFHASLSKFLSFFMILCMLITETNFQKIKSWPTIHIRNSYWTTKEVCLWFAQIRFSKKRPKGNDLTFVTQTSRKANFLNWIIFHWTAPYRGRRLSDLGYGACVNSWHLITHLMVNVHIHACTWGDSWLSLALKPSPNRNMRKQTRTRSTFHVC